MSSDRRDAAAAVDRATILVELGRFTQAIAAVTAALAIDPTNTRALCVLANAHLGAGRPAEALTAAWAAAASDPNAEWPHRLASRARANQGMWRDAADEARAAIRLAPTMANAFVLLAEAESGMHNLPDARAAAEHAVKLGPEQVTGYSALAAVALKQRDNVAAEQACQAALRLEPNTAWALNNLGVVCVRRRQPVQAARYFIGALRADPTQQAAQRNVRALRTRLYRLAVLVAMGGAAIAGYNSAGLLVSGTAGSSPALVLGLVGIGLVLVMLLAACGWRRHRRVVRTFLTAAPAQSRQTMGVWWRWRWAAGIPVLVIFAALVGNAAAHPTPNPAGPSSVGSLPPDLFNTPAGLHQPTAVMTRDEARQVTADLRSPVTSQTLDKYRADAAALKQTLELALLGLTGPTSGVAGPFQNGYNTLTASEHALVATLSLAAAAASPAAFQQLAPDLARQFQTAQAYEDRYISGGWGGSAAG